MGCIPVVAEGNGKLGIYLIRLFLVILWLGNIIEVGQRDEQVALGKERWKYYSCGRGSDC